MLSKRSAEIDFLRGIAVILVLFSHQFIFQPINEMGWIGVDLFFVISGFLVSGLLFQEYIRYGNIKPVLFLVRRGFKIYPLFYLTIVVTFILLVFFPDSYLFPESKELYLNTNGILIGLAIECFFLQSYFFGYWGHTWSLSVEEFFYFSLVALLFLMAKNDKLNNLKYFFRISLYVFSGILILRLVSNLLFPTSPSNYSAFHLRVDSLFAGVFISYMYHFQFEKLGIWYTNFKVPMRILFIPLICYVPFVNVLDSFFIKTIGFTFIYIAFSFLLLHFIFEPNILKKLEKYIGKWTIHAITKIGLYSYGIYLFHGFVWRFITGEHHAIHQYLIGKYTYLNVVVSFISYFIISVFLGIGASKLVEMPMLRIRDKYFPRRSI